MQQMYSSCFTRFIGKIRSVICLTAAFFAVVSQGHAQLAVESVWPGGVQMVGDRVGYSSPVIAELDGNTVNGQETIAASTNGTLQAFRSDGTLLWSFVAPDSGCGGPARIHSSPAVGALYGDGLQYVVVGYGGFERRCNGGVFALRGIDGALVWDFSTKQFAKKQKFSEMLHSVFSSPAMADTDGDGKMEVGFGSFDRNVYLLEYNGAVRWYYNAADTVWSSPAFANLDNDPSLEMILGTDISQNKRLKPATKNGGNLYAFKTKRIKKGKKFGFRDKSAFLWMKPLDQVLFSAPAVGDVLAENPGPEIVINSGCYFPERTEQKGGRWVKIFSGKNGKLLNTLPIEACSPSSPALGDVDGDGLLEIAVTVNGATSVGGDGYSRLSVFKASSPIPLWSLIPMYKGKNYSLGGNFISPVMADINRDGFVEVIVPVASGIGIYDGRSGAPLTCQTTPCTAPALGTGDIILNSPAIADIDYDGNLDIVAAGKHQSGAGGIYRWEVQSAAALGAGDAHLSVFWGMFRKNAQHSGS